MHMCAADLCVAAGLQTFPAGRMRPESQCRWKRPLPTSHFHSENAGAKKIVQFKMCAQPAMQLEGLKSNQRKKS